MVRDVMRGDDFLDTVLRADLCTGCGACAAIAPQKVAMGFDEAGYLRPSKQGALDRLQTRRIAAICPGATYLIKDTAPTKHPLWGGYRSCSQGWATDPALRHEAASGGALSAVLLSLLESKGVDAVLSIAADPEMPVGNKTVLSRTRKGILAQAASRYAPSMPLASVAEHLESDMRFAFVGKPCDVAGLRQWATQDPRIDERFPIKLSFFCAGVPSLTGAKQICATLGLRSDTLSEFRYRGRGWPGTATAVTADGLEASMSYQESWGDILSKHVQHRCRICADGIGLEADIAFADAWDCDAEGYPAFDEQPGRSAILVRTELGSRILEQAEETGAIKTTPLPIERLTLMQPGQRRRREELLGRLAGKVLSGEPLPRYRNLQIWQNGLRAGFRRTARACLGMARRRLRAKSRAKSGSSIGA